MDDYYDVMIDEISRLAFFLYIHVDEIDGETFGGGHIWVVFSDW